MDLEGAQGNGWKMTSYRKPAGDKMGDKQMIERAKSIEHAYWLGKMKGVGHAAAVAEEEGHDDIAEMLLDVMDRWERKAREVGDN